MKTKTGNNLIEEVEKQGVVVDQQLMEHLKEEKAIKYIFLKLVAILGSLLVVGFFFGFLILALNDSLNYISFLFFAAILYGLSFLGNKKTEPALRDGVFVATYISAIICVIAACIDLQLSEENTLLCFSILCGGGFFLFKSKLIQFISVLGLYYGLVYYLGNIGVGYVGLFLFWVVLGGLYFLFDRELDIKTNNKFLGKKYNPLVNALFFVLLFEVILDNLALLEPTNWFIRGRYGEYSWFNHRIYLVFAGIVLILLIYFTGKKINEKLQFQKVNLAIGLGCLFILGISFWMKGFGIPLAISLLLLLWSYLFRYQKGIVLALATLGLSLISYYYYLNVTLLVKSLILMGLGILFLGLFVINTKLNREK
ncbi:DUF4401 domain-containing protein [Myroides odoratus]|uniref:DUF4401 domain-containing protein n=1 Tax=Myroides odoratus TaxID=256 RepID=UPI0039AEA006